jgi:hypothetical protein
MFNDQRRSSSCASAPASKRKTDDETPDGSDSASINVPSRHRPTPIPPVMPAPKLIPAFPAPQPCRPSCTRSHGRQRLQPPPSRPSSAPQTARPHVPLQTATPPSRHTARHCPESHAARCRFAASPQARITSLATRKSLANENHSPARSASASSPRANAPNDCPAVPVRG